MERVKLELSDSMMDIIVKMSEGNLGALTVLTTIIETEKEKGLLTILHLDDMNIRGEQIWLGFKDHCGEDINEFIECTTKRNKEMLKTINAHCKEHVAIHGNGTKHHIRKEMA